MVQNMLRNPAYAGIYAYGRARRPAQAGPGTALQRQETGRAQPGWSSCPGYCRPISARSSTGEHAADGREPVPRPGHGRGRDGPALLAGLVRCGRCGRRMTVRYQRGPGGALQPSYVCGMAAATWAAERCQQLAGKCVDDYASGLALQAMAPAALRSPSPRRNRKKAGARKPTGSGGSASSAPTTPPTAPAASTSSPSRRTASSSASWRKTGTRPWPSAIAWARTTTGTSLPGPGP